MIHDKILATCVQETHRIGNDMEEIKNHLFLYHGPPTICKDDKRGVVGIILSPSGIKAWKQAGNPEPHRFGMLAHTTRMMHIDLHIKDSCNAPLKLRLYCCYFPHSGFDENEYNECILALQQSIENCPHDTSIIIAGNFNASIGIRSSYPAESNVTKCLGPTGNPHTNRRGEIVMDLLTSKHLCAINTFYKSKNDVHNTHWNHRINKARQLDHFFIHQKFQKAITFAGVDGNACTHSDHSAIAIKFRVAAFIPKKGLTPHPNRKKRDEKKLTIGKTPKIQQP